MRTCKTCGQTKPLEEFWSTGYCNGKRMFKGSCKPCYYDRVKQTFWERVIRLKGPLRCEKCGYDRCLAALEFHHRDPETKDVGVSRLLSASEQRLKEELNKCDLLCANCHREVHDER